MKVMLNASSNHAQQVIGCNTSKVNLSPRSIGKLHQNLHSQQAYGRKSPLVATAGVNLASIKDSKVITSTGKAVQAACKGGLENNPSNRFQSLHSGAQTVNQNSICFENQSKLQKQGNLQQ